MITRRTQGLASIVLLAAGLAGWLPAAAVAQYSDYGSLESRLSRIEREVMTLSQYLYTTGSPAAGGAVGAVGAGTGSAASADMEVRIARLERAIQELTGQVEESAYSVTQLRDRVNRLADDLEFRLSRLDGGSTSSGSGASTAAPPRPAASAPREPARAGGGATAPLASTTADGAAGGGGGFGGGPGSGVGTGSGLSAFPPPSRGGGPGSSPGLAPGAGSASAMASAGTLGGAGAKAGSGNPQADYDAAYAHLRKSNYEGAERAFRDFVGAYPDHKLTPNALYWLAETYYVRNMFKEAAVAFADGFKKEPNGGKAVDNLLKLGMSLASLNRTQEACVAFGQLLERFPSAPAASRRRAEGERQRLACK